MRDDEEPLNEDLLRRALAPDAPSGSRRAWDTDGQWRALRDRIAAEQSEEAAPHGSRLAWSAHRARRWLAAAAALVLAVGGIWYSRASRAPHYRTASTMRG